MSVSLILENKNHDASTVKINIKSSTFTKLFFYPISDDIFMGSKKKKIFFAQLNYIHL